MNLQSDLIASIPALVRKDPPPTLEDLAAALGMPAPDLEAAVDTLVETGVLVKTRKGRLTTPAQLGLVTGRVVRNPKGFAFLIPPDADMEDFFIPPTELGDSMHGDTVLARPTKARSRGGNIEASVERVLKRANDTLVGTYEPTDRGAGFVTPDERRIGIDILIPAASGLPASDGQKVVVRITRWPQNGRPPQGSIIEVLGHKDDVGTDILSILRSYHLTEAFPQEVVSASLGIPDEVPEQALKGRLDLREKLDTYTIDGAEAKDLDDAVSLSFDGALYHLGVHIADVSHYVRENAPIDREALSRGTSVYLVDRVLPMLPESLSNGICSLNPGVDRLTMSLLMDIDESGAVLRHTLKPAVIRTKRRLTYESVNDLLERDNPSDIGELRPLLTLMEKLQGILQARRERRGSIDFDIEEAHITLNEQGKPISVAPEERGIGNRIVEEFMLIANETVARIAQAADLPFVYRVHEQPDPEKMLEFSAFVDNFGIHLPSASKGIRPIALQRLLHTVAGKPEENIISRIMLRSLKKARYATENLGHFGLAATDYCHFTSPIRRYPDLIIHRILHEHVEGRMNAARRGKLEAQLPEVAAQCSERERAAMEAERNVDDLKKAEYMLSHIGETYDGIISGVTGFGFFVQLPSTVEGLVHISTLDDDFYEFHDAQYLLMGSHKKRTFRLGDPVRVLVSRVNLSARAVDFVLADA